MRMDRILISDIESTIYRYGRIYELMKIEREIENYRKTYKIGGCVVDTFMHRAGCLFFSSIMKRYKISFLSGGQKPHVWYLR